MRTLMAVVLLCGVVWCAEPDGLHLVAEDDCGSEDAAPHVVRGTPYLFAAAQVKEPFHHRTIIFDSQHCLLRYQHPKPKASYKVDVVYVTQAGARRVQRLEANGLVVHAAMDLPVAVPKSYRFDIPQAAVAGGKPLELKFINVNGANAVICHVRLWSTDPAPLSAEQQFWTPQGPVERDWMQQDRLRGKPSFLNWADPAREARENALPAIDEQLGRARKILADLRLLDAQGLDASERELDAVSKTRAELVAAKSLDPEAWCTLYRDVRWAVRRLAFKNPLLPQKGLLFVRRHHSDVMHQCARRLGAFTRPGGGVYILKEIRADGGADITCITEGRFGNGTFSRPDVSLDGKRVVFAHAPERTEGPPLHTYGQIGQLNYRGAHLFATHKLGYCQPFQVWEMGL
ncbi:hypothetical protein HQ560_08165, partial [bacterium]|nr:hypothetical protein [bacterium]